MNSVKNQIMNKVSLFTWGLTHTPGSSQIDKLFFQQIGIQIGRQVLDQVRNHVRAQIDTDTWDSD